MVFVEDLRHGVVPMHVQYDVADGDTFDVHILIAPDPRRWDAGFDDETAVVGEVPGSVGEAANLAVLGQQVVDGVVDQIDEWVPARQRHARHVANRHAHCLTPRLFPQPLEHGLGQLDAIDADTARRERQCNTPGADGELECGSFPGVGHQEFDGFCFVAPQVVVVAPRDIGTKTGCRIEAIHCDNFARIASCCNSITCGERCLRRCHGQTRVR